MNRYLLLICFLFLSDNVFAQNCEQNAKNMAEMRDCISRESRTGYTKEFDELKSLLNEKKMFSSISSLNDSQKKWTEYRDATCEYIFQIALNSEFGGYSQDEKSNCLVDFNSSREKILARYKKLCTKKSVGCDLK
jgi:uncharacterized protein YecT (DUF1311 family)